MFNLLQVAASVHTTAMDSDIQMPPREVMAAQRKAAALAASLVNAKEALQEADDRLFQLITIDASGINCSKIEADTEDGICFMLSVEKVSEDTDLPIIL